MRATTIGALMILGLLAACGSSSDPSGMKVTCARGNSVQPVTRVEVRVLPPTAQGPASALLLFRDPLNKDQTANLKIDAGDSCTIGLATTVP